MQGGSQATVRASRRLHASVYRKPYPSLLSGESAKLSWRDDRSYLFYSGLAGLAVQVQEPARGGECGAPTSADRLAAQGRGVGPSPGAPAVPRIPPLGRLTGYAGPPNRQAAEIVTDYMKR